MKLVLNFLHLQAHGVPEISTGVSLGVIAIVLAITTIVSLVEARRDPRRRAHAGALRCDRPRRGAFADIGPAARFRSVAEGTPGREQQPERGEPVRGELAAVDREPGFHLDDRALGPLGREQ